MRLARSLRGRLLLGMVVVGCAGLGASALLDHARQISPRFAVLETEPYQDDILLAFLSAGLLALIWFVTGWSVRPLERASREAAAIGPANPDRRLTEADLPAELAPLVGAVNAALDRLAAAYEAERRFTADAAHALRTPLAVLSLRLQRMRETGRHDWCEVESDLAEIGELVGRMLDLARKSRAARSADGRAPVNFARLLRETAASRLPLFEGAGRPLAVRAPDQLEVEGRSDDLRDLVANLLDNALLHGRGRVAVTLEEVTGMAVLVVEDEGSGFADDFVPAAFDRFSKQVAASPGTGLGLAIVREVAEGHGGDASAQSGTPCRVTVRLPRAPR